MDKTNEWDKIKQDIRNMSQLEEPL